MLKISNLYAQASGISILKGLNLQIAAGEIHAIMGPNGAGKSTLARIAAGHPAYEVVGGQIELDGQDLLALDPEERSWQGLFVGFQYPVEIPGVSNTTFLYEALNAKRKFLEQEPLTMEQFQLQLSQTLSMLHMPEAFKERGINEGFSGGEKKRNEILQLALLEPRCAILDETDSGLDIDAMRIVASGVRSWMRPERGLLLITHYQRLLEYIRPDKVHVMLEGQIVKSGGYELVAELEARGYDWLMPSELACE